MKITYIHRTLVLLLLGAALSSNAQGKDVEKVLDKATDFYKNKDQYKINMTFSLYRGLTGNTITETYKGTMEKSGEYSRNTILSTQVHRFSKAQLVIDATAKTMTYTQIDPVAVQNSPMEIGAFLKYYEKSQLLDTGENQWICEMVTTKKNFIQVPYSKVVLYINKKDYSISKQELYFTNLIPFKGKSGNNTEQDYGRLVIELKHDFDSKIQKRELKDFLTNTSGRTKQLQKEFVSYRLIDQTKDN
ncbi:MAG: hypothetical protein V3U92_15220 [Cellulophaga sp.]